jgi:uncharacterized membrane protein
MSDSTKAQIVNVVAGIIAAIVIMKFLWWTNIVVFAVSGGVESGALMAGNEGQATSMTEMLLSVLGFAVVVIGRFGEVIIDSVYTVFNYIRGKPNDTNEPEDLATELFNAAIDGDKPKIVRLINKIYGGQLFSPPRKR